MSVTLTVNGVGYAYPEVDDVDWGPDATSWASAVTSGMLQKAGGTFTLTADVDFGASYGLKSLYYKTRTASGADAGQFRLARADVISWRNEADDGNLDLSVDATNKLQFNGADIQGVVSVTDTATIDLTFVADVLQADIETDCITNAMINSAAAIAYSKLNLSGSIVNADVNASAAIVYSKLNLTGGIVNADVNASAAIAQSKLSLSITNTEVNASAAIDWSKMANLTVSRALVSDGSGDVSVATTTATEIGYVNGVTSAIQTQLDSKAGTASPTFTGVVGIADGLVGTPSLAFSSDLNTGLYRIGTDSMGLSAGGFLALGIGKSTGSFANVGMGLTPSASDQLPLGIERSNASAGTYIHVGNTSTSANSFGGIKVLGDNSANSGNFNAYSAASTVTAFISRVVLRADGNSTGVSIVPLGSGGQDVRFYHNGGTAADESLRINTDKSLQFMQQIAAPATPSSNTIKMYQKSGDQLYLMNDAGTEFSLNPMTAGGQIVYGGASGTPTALANGSAGQVLTSAGGTSAPSWSTVGGTQAYRSVTTTDAPTNADYTLDCSGASFTMTLFTAVGNQGKIIVIKHSGTSLTQVYTLATTSGQTIGGVASGNYALYTAGESVTLQSTGAQWIIIDRVITSPWVNSGVTVLSGTTLAPTKASGIVIDKCWWRRIGDSAHIRWYYQQSNTTSAAAGTGDYLFGVPANMTIDTAKCTVYATVEGWAGYFTQAYSVGSGTMGNGTNAAVMQVIPYDASYVRMFGMDVSNTGTPAATGGYNINVNAGVYYCLDFIVPITGWQP